MTQETDVAQGAGGINIQLSLNVTKDRNLVLLTHLPAGAPKEQLDQMLDLLNKSGDRLEAKYTILGLQAQLEKDQSVLANVTKDLDAINSRHQADWIASGKRGEFKLGPKEKQEKLAATHLVERMTQDVARVTKRIAEMQELAK